MSESNSKINQIRNYLGFTQEQFAQYFHISSRTLEKWDGGFTNPPEHVIYMIQKIIKQEELISKLEVKLRLDDTDVKNEMNTYVIGDSWIDGVSLEDAIQSMETSNMDFIDSEWGERRKTEIDELGLSPRAIAGIRSLGIRTIAEFKTKNADYFDREKNPKVKNVGKKTYLEIVNKLEDLNR